MTQPTVSPHKDMRTKILELIDRKMLRVHPKFTKPILQELREEIEKMDEWIPVTEIPEIDDHYLVCTVHYSKYILEWDGERKLFGELIDGEWCSFPNEYITHWQPLPLPPNN